MISPSITKEIESVFVGGRLSCLLLPHRASVLYKWLEENSRNS